jgi:hypothetical protein
VQLHDALLEEGLRRARSVVVTGKLTPIGFIPAIK